MGHGNQIRPSGLSGECLYPLSQLLSSAAHYSPNNQSPVQMATLQNTPESLGNSLITWCPHQNCSIRLSGPEVGTSASLTNSDGHHKVCFRQSLCMTASRNFLLAWFLCCSQVMNEFCICYKEKLELETYTEFCSEFQTGEGTCWALLGCLLGADSSPAPTLELILSLNLPELLLWE